MACSDEELASLNVEEDLASPTTSQTFLAKHRRGLLGGAAVACLLLCGTVFALTASARTTTVRELLERPDTQQIMAHDMLTMGQDMSAEEMSRAVQWKLSTLKEENPEALRKLETTRFSDEQVAAAHRLLRSMSDERLHHIRKDIIAAIKETFDEDGDHEALKRHLVEKLGPRNEEMRQLHDTYFPQRVNGRMDKGLPLEPKHFDRMRLVKAFDSLKLKAHAKAKDADIARKLTDDGFSSFFDEISQSFDDMGTDFDSQMTEMQTEFENFFSSSDSTGTVDTTSMESCFDDSTGGSDDFFSCMSSAMESMFS